MDWCPVQRESTTLICLILQEPEIRAGSVSHLARKRFSVAFASHYISIITYLPFLNIIVYKTILSLVILNYFIDPGPPPVETCDKV